MPKNELIISRRIDLMDIIRIEVKDAVNEAITSYKKEEKARNDQRAYINRQEAADILQISLSTLQRLVNQQHLIARKIGRKTLFLLSDVQNVVLTLNK